MDVHLEEDKYYIPPLDELNTGLEVEIQNIENGQWGKYTIKHGDNLEEDLNIGCLRVKYLDVEDMLSLGFTQDKDYKCSFTGKSGNKFFRKDESAGFNNGVFFIITLGGGSMIQLQYAYYSSYSNPSGKIQMIVKNKLELSKLLNQFSN